MKSIQSKYSNGEWYWLGSVKNKSILCNRNQNKILFRCYGTLFPKVSSPYPRPCTNIRLLAIIHPICPKNTWLSIHAIITISLCFETPPLKLNCAFPRTIGSHKQDVLIVCSPAVTDQLDLTSITLHQRARARIKIVVNWWQLALIHKFT